MIWRKENALPTNEQKRKILYYHLYCLCKCRSSSRLRAGTCSSRCYCPLQSPSQKRCLFFNRDRRARREKNGDIYKKPYKGLYCLGHEAFVTEKDFDENGRCLIHETRPELIEEENYFFRLSRYQEQLKNLIEKNELKIIPETRKNEVLSFIGEELEDLSVSRPAKDIGWGVPVPGDSAQTIYVWFDALCNYISALGFAGEDSSKFNKFWPADLHIIGKDILRFHAIIWPAMLISAGLPLPKEIFIHGFITVGGKKMSKTIGNIADPILLIEKYGEDALRTYLIKSIHQR